MILRTLARPIPDDRPMRVWPKLIPRAIIRSPAVMSMSISRPGRSLATSDARRISSIACSDEPASWFRPRTEAERSSSLSF